MTYRGASSSPSSVMVGERATSTIPMAVEGLAYGGFMVAGQTYVAESTTERNRGTVGGVYAMASGVMGVVAPYALSLIARQWSLRAVFAASGVTLAFGFLVFAAGLAVWKARERRLRSSSARLLAAARVSDDRPRICTATAASDRTTEHLVAPSGQRDAERPPP